MSDESPASVTAVTPESSSGHDAIVHSESLSTGNEKKPSVERRRSVTSSAGMGFRHGAGGGCVRG